MKDIFFTFAPMGIALIIFFGLCYMLVRGIFYEGWQPTHVPDKSIRTRQDFFDGVTRRMLPHHLPPVLMVKTVFAILSHHIEPGEISDIIGQLPDSLKELWPLNARTFKERAR